MSFKDKVIEQLILHEGVKLKPYKCTAGKLTIGIGRNLESRGITEHEAYMLCSNDVNDINRDLQFQWPFYTHLDDARRAVLLNMAFNLGISGLLKFKKMLAALLQLDYSKAAAEMLDSKWAKQVGSRADDLAKQMRTGEWL